MQILLKVKANTDSSDVKVNIAGYFERIIYPQIKADIMLIIGIWGFEELTN